MRLVTLEGYDNGLGFSFKKIGKSIAKTAKKTVKSAVKNPIKLAVSTAMTPIKLQAKAVDTLAKKAGIPVPKLTSIVNKAQNIATKMAMKAAPIVIPMVASTLGIPPQATKFAMASATTLMKSGKLNKKSLMNIAKKAGIPGDKLAVAVMMTKADTPEKKLKAIKAISKKNPKAGKEARKLANAQIKKEAEVKEKAGDKAITKAYIETDEKEKVNKKLRITADQQLNIESVAMQYFNKGILR